MAELHVVEDERPGILKEIDEGAMDLIFQAIQQDIYSFPMKSFIRESVSNGLDSIKEKEIHLSIINGDPVNKYFLERTDDKLLKDSSYTPEYYNNKYLSSNNKVLVTYKEQSPRDLVSIKDEGVGLGGSRLKGYFKLGYSSKRNMKDVIGKFGAGAKSGLATGVDYFVMHTVYNGYKTSFMIYNNDYENITPKTENSKTEVWIVKMANGKVVEREIYWEPTLENNGVQIDLEVKKHNKYLCLDAIKSQFQYFKGKVRVNHVEESGYEYVDDLNETPLYESDALLIPKYSTYSSPHILVDGISYGLISWDELELEKRQGKIAIKVKATDVDITQSRESLKWTEKTKNTILEAIKIAKNEAEDYISSLLTIPDPDNIFEVNDIYGRLSRNSGESVGSVFSTFLVMHSITPKISISISETKKIEEYLSEKLFYFLFYSFRVRSLSLNSYKTKISISAFEVNNFKDIRNCKIIYAESSSLGPKLAAHLLNKFNVSSIIYIRPSLNTTNEIVTFEGVKFTSKEIEYFMKEFLEKYSTLFLDAYEVNYQEKEEDLEKEQDIKDSGAETKLALSEIRKQNQEVLFTTYTNRIVRSYISGGQHFILVPNQIKNTTKIKELKTQIEKIGHRDDVVVCTVKYSMLGKLLELSSLVFNSPLKVLYVAQDIIHHFTEFATPFDEYYRKINPKTGELMIGSHIRNLNTWRIFSEFIQSAPDFSSNFMLLKALTSIDISEYTRIMNKGYGLSPRQIIEKTYHKDSSGVIEDIFAYLKSLEDFQKVVQTADKTAIAEKALQLFNTDKIYTIDSYDVDFIETVKNEFKRLEPITPLLNALDVCDDYALIVPLIEELLTTLNNKNDNF